MPVSELLRSSLLIYPSRSTDWCRTAFDSICHVTEHDMHGNQLAPRCYWITKWTNKGQSVTVLKHNNLTCYLCCHHLQLNPPLGAPFSGPVKRLDGKSSVGPFCLFSVHFCFLLEGSVTMDCGHFRAGDEGMSTLVVVGSKGGGWAGWYGRGHRKSWSAPGVTWCLGSKREEYRAWRTNMSKCSLHYR